MSRRRTYYEYTLDANGITGINPDELAAILRAAYDLAGAAGRNMLVKVLKGSKDQKIKEHEMDKCPAYASMRDFSTEEISGRVDYTILAGYLNIEYSGKLPLIYFSPLGWELTVPMIAREYYAYLEKPFNEGQNPLPLPFNEINRDVQFEILKLVEQYGNARVIPLIQSWKYGSYKKVKARIDEVTLILEKKEPKPKNVPHNAKLAVLFPGIGYTCDKPLLYYSRKLAEESGFDILCVDYGKLPANAKSSPKGLEQAIVKARASVENALQDTAFTKYDDIVFISKSIGTILALEYAQKNIIPVRHILLTPLMDALNYPTSQAIAFCGTNDPRADAGAIADEFGKREVPCFAYMGANHSLETGNVKTDLATLGDVTNAIFQFLNNSST